ncbi:3D domain-containing protein [Deinococcus roseus]|uniref:3D domain-containing protein n=1 Tax=Deinococcus roseus TaxID=392414 RepID=A0ABQ2CTY6_9DEIO|nr:3D domain-containing protein [Deinococcus roseus]GGJ20119.1 hypothetical protein GCM10008938_02850 [Deinococcus roseus]
MAKRTLRFTLIGTALLCSVLNLSTPAHSEAEKKSLKVEIPLDPVLPADSLAEKALELTQPAPVQAQPAQVVKAVQQIQVTKTQTIKAPVKTQTVKTPVKAQTAKVVPAQYRSGSSFILKATAYNSFSGQTDSSPHITATGARTRFGIVALSRDMLRKIPYGSKVRIELLGKGASYYNRLLSQTVFVVEDTMHPRKYGQVDIWMRSSSEARSWGVRQVRLTVLR